MMSRTEPMRWSSRARAMRRTRVLVLGLGVTGTAVAKVLAEAGAEVYASEERRPPSDDPEISELLARGVTLELGAHDRAERWLGDMELVIPTPGMSPTTPILASALASGVRVQSEIEVASRFADAPVVAVTGTNGKTTTCQMIGAILEAYGKRVTVCGNIGRTFIEAVAAAPTTEVFVVETSSFQLAFCEGFHPRVAVVTNLAPDHFDWHATTEDYHAAKARIARRQTPEDRFVHPADDPRTAAFAPSDGPRRVPFSVEGPLAEGAWLDDGEIAIGVGAQRWSCGPIGPLAARGRPFVEDAIAACAASVSLAEITADEAERMAFAAGDAIRAFRPDRHRVEVVEDVRGVRFVNDSKATNPHATVAAIRTFDRVVLIAGGRNKGLDLKALAGEADRLRGVVAIGEASGDVLAAFADTDVPAVEAPDMNEAVDVAFAMAEVGDAVLLSPACSSYDAYANYAERGEAFISACRAISERETG